MPEPFPVARARPDASALSLARRMFFDEGRAPAALVPSPIIDSWQRCINRGLSARQQPDITPVTVHELNALLEQHEGLRRVAKPEMAALGAVASATQSILVLTDPHGFVLETIGDLRFASRAAAVSLRPGTAWDEASSGTNAIGAAIMRRGGVAVRGGEHFFEPHGILSCAATPIFDPRGAMIGVLDLTGPAAHAHPHTLGLVEMAVAQIEHRQFDRGFEGLDVMIVNHDPKLLGTAREGVLVFEGQRLVAASRAGLAFAGLEPTAIGLVNDEDIFREKIARGPGEMTLRGRANGRLFARFREPNPRAVVQGAVLMPRLEGMISDATLEDACARGARWLSVGLPVVISGESGTGKTRLAERIHRTLGEGGALIRIACGTGAAEALSDEIFGAEGALNSGPETLVVLEDFCALPLPLQARLAQALGADTPGTRRILATTTGDVEAERSAGRLRADYLYALAQGRLTLPPLHQRADLSETIRAMMAALGGGAPDEDTLSVLAAHRWPGNLRELSGVIRAMVALAGPGVALTRGHLPPYLGEAAPPQAPATRGDLNTLTLAAMQAALAEAGGNVSRAARKLGVDRTTLYRRLLWKERERGNG